MQIVDGINRIHSEMIVVQEGDATVSYNRGLYRAPVIPESEPSVKRIERQLPVRLQYNLHGAILVPSGK